MTKKGSLKHLEYQFTASVGAVSGIVQKDSSHLSLNWRVAGESEGKDMANNHSVFSSESGVASSSDQLKTHARIVYNKDTGYFLKKKSVICVSFIDQENKEHTETVGWVTVDLGLLAREPSSPFKEYTLERSQFEDAKIQLKFTSKKLREAEIDSVSWQQPSETKQVSTDTGLDSTQQNQASITINQNSKSQLNIFKTVDQQLIFGDKKGLTKSNHSSDQIQLVSDRLQQKETENKELSNRISELERQNSQLRELAPLPCKRSKTLEEELGEIDQLRDQVNPLENSKLDFSSKDTRYNSLFEENKYVLDELQKVSIELVTREKEIKILRSEYDKLKKKESKNRKVDVSSDQSKQQIFELSSEIMRLHGQLANFRETQIQSREIKIQKQSLQVQLSESLRESQTKSCQIQGLQNIIQEIRSQQPCHTQKPNGENPSAVSIKETLQQMKIDEKTTADLIQFLRCKAKQTPSDITNHLQKGSLTNQKIREIASEFQKLKSNTVNGMSSESKKRFLSSLKSIDNKLNDAILQE